MHDGEGGADRELDRLAAGFDAELRAEQAEYEAMALQAEWRARTLPDLAAELVVRGDVAEVHVADRVLRGRGRHAGQDLLVLDTPSGAVDVALVNVALLQVVERSYDGGTAAGRGARTLRARMTEHETARTPLTVLLVGGLQLEGRVLAAAADHLLLDERRGPAAVPWAAVAAAWPLPR